MRVDVFMYVLPEVRGLRLADEVPPMWLRVGAGLSGSFLTLMLLLSISSGVPETNISQHKILKEFLSAAICRNCRDIKPGAFRGEMG